MLIEKGGALLVRRRLLHCKTKHDPQQLREEPKDDSSFSNETLRST
jgi:hypothetical protein